MAGSTPYISLWRLLYRSQLALAFVVIAVILGSCSSSEDKDEKSSSDGPSSGQKAYGDACISLSSHSLDEKSPPVSPKPSGVQNKDGDGRDTLVTFGLLPSANSYKAHLSKDEANGNNFIIQSEKISELVDFLKEN